MNETQEDRGVGGGAVMTTSNQSSQGLGTRFHYHLSLSQSCTEEAHPPDFVHVVHVVHSYSSCVYHRAMLTPLRQARQREDRCK